MVSYYKHQAVHGGKVQNLFKFEGYIQGSGASAAVIYGKKANITVLSKVWQQNRQLN